VSARNAFPACSYTLPSRLAGILNPAQAKRRPSPGSNRKHEVPVSTSRPRVIASSLLLFSALVGFVLGALSRPRPAYAAGNRQLQFVFGPVQVTNTQSVFFSYFNTATLPTPPATAIYRDLLSGAVLGTTRLASVPPGVGTAGGIGGGDKVYMVVVTFDRPAAGQAIPKPCVCNVEVVNQTTSEVTAILSPVP